MPSNRSKLTRLLTCAGAVAAVLFVLPVPTASAAEETGRDVAGDVRSRGVHVDTTPRQPEPQRKLGDIVRYGASYDAALVVTTRFRDLSARGHQEFSWYLRTSGDRFEWYAALIVKPGQDAGAFTLIDPLANRLRCGRAELDRSARTVTLRIPRSCLRNPAWVKVAHGARVYARGREYSDDARRDTVKASGWTFGPKLGQ
ncbi:MAG TPA: hypothetical protein PLZ93_12475 [Nocardioides sp.]|uniref:hypothetical protein n=1 Tax=uncultured Nocardioides sp. TaxID=198441 RepID=UPI00260B4C6F|nr:hypothetical protein [uncultured Nocardioides sp.]HRD60348.1 hypothetical protein [Nocardioides sp.]HRI96426.1 hypothetical protein [Nocardioides sp.]